MEAASWAGPGFNMARWGDWERPRAGAGPFMGGSGPGHAGGQSPVLG